MNKIPGPDSKPMFRCILLYLTLLFFSFALATSLARAEKHIYWHYEKRKAGIRVPGWIGLQIGPELSCNKDGRFSLYMDLGTHDYEDGDHVAIEIFAGKRSFRLFYQAVVALNRDSIVVVGIPSDVAKDLVRELANAKVAHMTLHGGKVLVGRKFPLPMFGMNRAMRAFAVACGIVIDPPPSP